MSTDTVDTARAVRPEHRDAIQPGALAANNTEAVNGNHAATGTQATNGSHANDDIAIRALFQKLLDAWARADGQAYGSLFTDDADYIAFDGSHRRGTRAIADEHQQLFDTWLKGTRLVGTVQNVRFLGSEVALLQATGGTIFPGQHDNGGRRPSIQTLVAVKRDGDWAFTAFHNTRIVKRNKLQWMLYGIFSPIFDR